MTDEELRARAAAYVERVWEDVVGDIATLVSIRSVEDLDHAVPGKPYGPAPYEALQATVDIAQRLGLDAHNCDGHIGYADVAGASPRQVALIAHSDVVPEGPGWTFDPYTLTRKDGYLIGRGVLDDKGPLVVSLYVARFFKELAEDGTAGANPYTLRVIIGSNEETGMADVEWYLRHHPQPAFVFSPDADFPLICGEKGGLQATIASGQVSDVIVSLEGGTVPNAVAGEAAAVVRANASTLSRADRIAVEDLDDGTCRVSAQGISSHASLPAGSINAIGLLVDYLLEHGLCNDEERRFLEFEQLVLGSTDGSTLGIACSDDRLGALTCIGGTVRTVHGRFEQTIDARYPEAITGDEIVARVGELAHSYGAQLVSSRDMVPFYTDPTSAPMQALVGTYNEFTGRQAQAFTIGGGTYARHFAAGGAFGPNDPAEPAPSWVGMEHAADEGFSEELLKRAMQIYIVSVARLMELSL